MEVLRNKKSDNRGSAIVLVIVSMAFIGILATMILWMSFMNYRMKVTDKKSTDNFYAAESVVEQMRTGLEAELSDAVKEAYQSVLQRYADPSYTTETRQTYFNSLVVQKLTAKLMGESTGEYDMEQLCGYISGDAAPSGSGAAWNVTFRSGKDKADIKGTGAPACLMTVSDNTIILKDVDVTYTNDENYVARIHTDFKLEAPTLANIDAREVPDLMDYSIVANDRLKGEDTGRVDFEGSVYGGNCVNTASDDDPDQSIQIFGNSEWNFKSASHLISGQGLVLGKRADGATASMTTADDVKLWAGDIILNGNTASLALDGVNFVADDLTLNGSATKVTLAGEYKGYGMDAGVDGSESSAILINGKNSTLDISQLDNILLAGRSYVGTKNAADRENTYSNENIPMSESIAVKGDQVAYLLPGESLDYYLNGVSGNQISGQNPMTTSAYGSRTEAQRVPDLDIVPDGMTRPLSYYAYAKEPYRIVTVQGLSGGLVYYYLVMEPDKAEEYFRDYYAVPANKKRLDTYGDRYLNLADSRISMADDAMTNILGNWFAVSSGILNLKEEDMASTEDEISEDSELYTSSFRALNTNLTVEQGSDTGSVYDNLVKTQTMKKVRGVTLKFEDDESDLNAIVTDVDSYTYPSGGGDDNTRVIIASGDVTLASDFSGTCICGGTVTILPGVSAIVNNDAVREEILQVLTYKRKISGKEYHVYDFLENGEAYLDQDDSDDESVSDNSIELNELVTYENWSKR